MTPYRRKEAWDPSGTNGRALWGSSMAKFSGVPHLTMVLNYGGAILPLDVLQTKSTRYGGWQERLLASPIVHARTNTIPKVMKAIGIPQHNCSPNYFEMDFVKRWQSSQTRRFFSTRSAVPGAVLMSPHATANFSLWWRTWNSFSSSPTPSSTNLVYGTYPASCKSPNNLFSSAWLFL